MIDDGPDRRRPIAQQRGTPVTHTILDRTREALSTGLAVPLDAPLLATGISKSFPGVHAVRDVDFDLRAAEIHGLVGANGAGKSTFIRVLAGATRPDKGSIAINGRPRGFDDPREARIAGVAIIYQELTIVPEMTALSNVFLGSLMHAGPFISRRRMRRRYHELSQSVGLSVPPHRKAGALSVASQQMLEIMRALQARHNVLIMDEPTASLGPVERERLYALMRRLRAEGTSIIFISHDLDEVLLLCDRVSVMRDGRLVATNAAADWTKASLVQGMLGDIEIMAASHRPIGNRPEVLRVAGLSAGRQVADVGFTLHCGEVLGIAGLVGAGRTEILRALAGVDPSATGKIRIDDVERPLPRHVREAVALGIALVPEDRKTQGLVLGRTAASNILLADLDAVSTAKVLRRATLRHTARSLARRVGYSLARLDTTARTLSGGNQQKLVIGKWLHRQPRILLLDEPTRGIDVGSKQEIFRTIRDLADGGMSVVLVSSDLEEIVDNCDAVMVIARGRRIGMLCRAEASVRRILDLIFAVEGLAD